MRALIIGPDEKAAIAKVVAYAIEPDHFYRIQSGQIPGDDPNFVVRVPDGFRCVFTYTRHSGKLFRHLTVSVPGKDRRPNDAAMIALAEEFGFTITGPDASKYDLTTRMERDRWLFSEGHEGENCAVVIQPVEEEPHA